jgi:hypothetical protein
MKFSLADGKDKGFWTEAQQAICSEILGDCNLYLLLLLFPDV